MFKNLKYSLASHIARKLQALTGLQQTEKLKSLRQMQGVTISDTVITGEGTGFIIEGEYEKLIIEENVYTRKFCNFLLFSGASLVIGKTAG